MHTILNFTEELQLRVRMLTTGQWRDLDDDERRAFLQPATMILDAVREAEADLAARRRELQPPAFAKYRAQRLATLQTKITETAQARAKILRQVDELRANALRGFVRQAHGWTLAPPPEFTSEDLHDIREVRARLATLSPPECARRYLEAVAAGDDPILTAAFERSPKSFPLVDDATRARADALRIAQSPVAGSIEALEGALAGFDHFVAIASTGLAEHLP
jgi:hypothetical protein